MPESPCASIAPVATVLMEVTLGNHRQADFDRFERAIRDIPEIVACWSVGGGVDYVLKVMARDIDAYQRLVDGAARARDRHRPLLHLHRHQDGEGGDRAAGGGPAAGTGRDGQSNLSAWRATIRQSLYERGCKQPLSLRTAD